MQGNSEISSDSPKNGIPQPEAISLSEAEVQAMYLTLRRKEGAWTEWGAACQTLQKAGYNDQEIFEATGFEAIQQNQIIVAAQVYRSATQNGLNEAASAHFGHRASDVLYEFRILTHADRALAADYAHTRAMDCDEARELAKAMKEFSRISQPPVAFSSQPGDILAYYAWRAAKQNSNLQDRSILIAKGLRYAQTDLARQQITTLLTDFANPKTLIAPRLPVYRLDSDEELPRLVPVAGTWPVSAEALKTVPITQIEGPFGLVRSSLPSTFVPIPGWQVIRKAQDPVIVLMPSDRLPTRLPGQGEEVLVVIDRAVTTWDIDGYFVPVDATGSIEIQWFPEAPDRDLLGRVILIMRPRRVIDESYSQELYQWDE